MKTMTCKQLGGACDKIFQANTFEKMIELSMQHGIEMKEQNEEAHVIEIEKMKVIMLNPNTMHEWFGKKKAEFDALAED